MIQALLAGALVATTMAFGLSPASATSITPPGGGESGNINPGDLFRVGYHFSIPGNNQPVTVSWTNLKATVNYTCPGGGTGSYDIPMPDYTVTVSDGNLYPASDQHDPAVYQGVVSSFPDLCGNGGVMKESKIAVFTGDVTSLPAGVKVSYQFHQAITNASGSWSSNPSVVTTATPTPISQTLQSEIYQCSSGTPTTTLVSGGSLAAPSASLNTGNPLAPTSVAAAAYGVNATAPAGYQCVVCGQSGVTISSPGSASQSVTVPSGGAGDGKFYVAPIPPVTQTIQGEIYTCVNGVPSTSLISGGTVAVPSAGLSSTNPLAASQVAAGDYTVNATAPAGYHFVACGVPGGGTGTQSVTVPSGGAGDGVFYVVQDPAPVTQTIQGEIYTCVNGVPSTSLVSGGTVAVSSAALSSANPLAASQVAAGAYTETAVAPAGYQFVTCGQSGVTISGSTSGNASQSVTVPSGGAGDGKFYVAPIPAPPVQTIQGEIYRCVNGVPSSTLVPGGTIAVPTAGLSSANPMAASQVAPNSYTVDATAPAGYHFVACGVPGGGTGTQSVTVPSGGAGDGIFYVVQDPAPVTQTIQGEIYVCVNGVPSTSLVSGGSVAVPGAGLSSANPLAASQVGAGTYAVNATAPAGYHFVVCGVPGGGTGTQSVTVPSGGAGDGIFYVVQDPAPVTQTIQGEIYECVNGVPTKTVVSGGTVAVPSAGLSSGNPLGSSQVGAGTYTVNATAPAGYHFVSCGQPTGGSGSQSVTVPSGGAGDGIFYVVQDPAPVTQTIQGEIYVCVNGIPSTSLVSGGSVAVPGAGLSSANPLAASQVGAGTYAVNATAPAGYHFVSCGQPTGGTGSQSVTVPSGGAGDGIFYVVQDPAPVTQTIQGEIYECVNGVPTKTVVSGGKVTVPAVGLSGSKSLAPSKVPAGSYTVNATAPAGYHFASCGHPGGNGSQTVTVPVGGAGDGVFYVVKDLTAPAIKTTASKPTVSMAIAANGTTKAVKLHDVVTISRFVAGAAATGKATLYGPVAKISAGMCTSAKVVKTVAFVPRNGTFNTAAVAVNKPGYYTWVVSTAANSKNKAASHACGLKAETTLVVRANYGPIHIETGLSGIAAKGVAAMSKAVAPGTRPLSVSIPAIGLAAPLNVLGLSHKSMQIPGNVQRAAWLKNSAMPGDLIGATVIAGHVSDNSNRPGAFSRLAKARVGQIVRVRGANGKLYRYRITSIRKQLRTQGFSGAAVSNTGAPRLTLVTCTNLIHLPGGHFHYTKNLIVVATMIS